MLTSPFSVSGRMGGNDRAHPGGYTPEEVKEVKAEVTVVGGKIVYKSDKTRLFYQG